MLNRLKVQPRPTGESFWESTITAVDGDFEISDEESKKDAASVSGGVSTQDARYEEIRKFRYDCQKAQFPLCHHRYMLC